MSAVIEPLERVPANGLIPRHDASGGAQRREIAIGRRKASDRVDEDSHRGAGSCPFGQRGQEAIADFSGVKDERYDMDAFACCADGGELCFVEGFAVGENFDCLGVLDGGAGNSGEETQECARAR